MLIVKDKIKYGGKAQHAVGKVSVCLTDPLTGRVTDKREGINHIFPESLNLVTDNGWISYISTLQTLLTDDAAAVDTTFPYVLGNIIGYGTPSLGTSGLYRGAYNAANQVLAQANGLTSVRWKFQYDFTTAQAIGTISRIGLTGQLLSTGVYPQKEIVGHTIMSTCRLPCDGRYAYECSTAGIVTVHDLYLDVDTTIDLSATVGTTSSSYKNVAYNPVNGKCYIVVYSSTASLRKVYEFSDSSFSTLLNTYSPTNLSAIFGQGASCQYVYNDNLFSFEAYNTVNVIDFVSNGSPSTITVSNIFGTNPSAYNSVGIGTRVTFLGAVSSAYPQGYIFDLSSQAKVGDTYRPGGGSTSFSTRETCCKLPLYASTLIARRYAYGGPTERFVAGPAVAMKALDPITKDGEHGMTVTYELEVFW